MPVTAAELQRGLDERQDALERQKWITENAHKLSATWSKIRGRNLTRDELNDLLGDPNSESTKRMFMLLENYQRAEGYYDAMKANGIEPKKFGNADAAVTYYADLETRFGGAGNLNGWLGATGDFISKNRGAERRDKLTTAMQLAAKYGTIQDYQNYSSVAEVMKAQGLDIRRLNKGRVNRVMAQYGSAAGYSNWLKAGDTAADFQGKFKDMVSLGFAAPRSTSDVQKQIYERGAQPLQDTYEEMLVRKKYLYAGVGGGSKSEAPLGADPTQGAWWREE